MPDFIEALQASRFIPTPHWEPRCEICRLSRDLPEAFGWLTRALLDGRLTQEEVAAELGTRWRLTIHQSQVSTHKTKHLDPSIADAYETFAGHLAMLEVCGELPPEKLAAMYLQLAMIKLGEQLQQSADAEISAKLGGAIAQLGRALQGSAKLPLELELADLDARQARTRAALAEGQYREAFARWVEAHYPDLVPTLAAQPAAAVLQEQGDDRDAS